MFSTVELGTVLVGVCWVFALTCRLLVVFVVCFFSVFVVVKVSHK